MKNFLCEEDRLDILVNNAGILPLENEIDAWGVNKVMATNHLGPFLLTTLLLPLLEKTARAEAASDVRIVNVSSSAIDYLDGGHSFGSLEAWNDDFGGEGNPMHYMQRYAYSKAANVLFTGELQRKLNAKGSRVLVVAVHPGVVGTPGAEKVMGKESEMYKAAISAYEGALTPVWAAAHLELREKEGEYKGAFVVPYGVRREVGGLACDTTEAKALWETSEKILREVVGI